MTEAKFTPGPWTIEEYGDDEAPALVIHRDSESRVCFMATPGSHGDPAKIEADARLIAAAPEMLAALQEIEEFLDNQADVDDGRPNDAMRLLVELRSALAKAGAA